MGGGGGGGAGGGGGGQPEGAVADHPRINPRGEGDEADAPTVGEGERLGGRLGDEEPLGCL